MSIYPVPGIGSATNPQSAEESVPPARKPASGPEIKESAQANPGTPPKREIRISQSVSESPEMPQDAVEVHRDNETADIVIRYLDHSGNVILQVPSSEVLSVAHSIDLDFQKQARERAGTGETTAASEGGEIHGH